jgi:hypothetical protein
MLDKKTEPLCSATLVGEYFQEQDIRYLVYEKDTQAYYSGFDEDDDAAVRVETRAILKELRGSGVLERFYEDDSYEFYRLVRSRPRSD